MMKFRNKTRRGLVVAALGWPAVCAGDNEALELFVVHRPPYLVAGPHQQMSGISVEPTMRAFENAGIAVRWREMPALRQLALLQRNAGKFCSVGWYKTPEREKYAKYSRPVSQDGPWVAVVTLRFQISAVVVDDILGDARLTVLAKQGFVYGSYLDRKLRTMKAMRVETTADMPQLFTMLALGRADVLFAPREEAEYYLSQDQGYGKRMRIIAFKEMPQGYHRHLMCSQQVSDNDIARFDAALARRAPR